MFEEINLPEWVLLCCFTALSGVMIILLINIMAEVWDYLERSQSWLVKGNTQLNIYDEHVMEEIWLRNQNSKHYKLLLPPMCIKKTARDEGGRNRAKSLISVQNTKRLVKRLYKVALGKGNSSDRRNKDGGSCSSSGSGSRGVGGAGLGWEIDLAQFQIYCSYDQASAVECTPLLCFINSRSGGQQGLYYKEQLLKLLNPYQVIDLSIVKNPVLVLQEFSKLPTKIKILVCGGDGTISWILDSIDQIEKWSDEQFMSLKPEVAILPIGTGNDLANELGWSEVMENHVLSSILHKIQSAHSCYLDRWRLTIHPPSGSSSSSNSSSKKTKSDPSKKKHFQNYFGIGVDAQIVLQFHLMRNMNPSLFFHQYVNKLMYGIMGWREIWKQSCESLPQDLELYYNGERVALPSDAQGVVFLNISSYGGGSVLWKEEGLGRENTVGGGMDSLFVDSYDAHHPHDSMTHSETSMFSDSAAEQKQNQQTQQQTRKRFLPVSIEDGMLEVVAVKSSFELAQVKLGITSCHKIVQGDQFEVILNRNSVPMQIDGEPWIQSPGKITINLLHETPSSKVIMCKPLPSEGNVNILVECLDTVQSQQIITKFQAEKILKEYLDRVHQNLSP